MPKKPDMRNAVYNYLLAYFKNRYEERQASRIRRDKPDERKFPTAESIVDFVLEHDELCETNTGIDPKPYQISISRGTVRKAVKQLIDDHKIDIVNKSYEFIPRMERSLEYHPTLEIADKIDITVGVPDEIIVLSVAPEFTISVSNYLSALFYKDDIMFIPIAGKILCISVFPESVVNRPQNGKTVNPSATLRNRIEMALHRFNCHYPKFPYGKPYEFAYHASHNPDVIKFIAAEAKEKEKNRPYHSTSSILGSIQDAAFLMAEQNCETPQPKYNPETGLEDDDEPLGEPSQDEWEFMDDGLV